MTIIIFASRIAIRSQFRFFYEIRKSRIFYQYRITIDIYQELLHTYK